MIELRLTPEEFECVLGCVEGTEDEYGLSSGFFNPPNLPTGATVTETRAAYRAASDEADAKAQALLTKLRGAR